MSWWIRRSPDATNEGPVFASNLLRGDYDRFKRKYFISHLNPHFLFFIFLKQVGGIVLHI